MHELAYASGLAVSMWKTNNLCAQAAFKDRSQPGHLAQIRAACAHGVVIHHRSILMSRNQLMESVSRSMSMRPQLPGPLTSSADPIVGTDFLALITAADARFQQPGELSIQDLARVAFAFNADTPKYSAQRCLLGRRHLVQEDFVNEAMHQFVQHGVSALVRHDFDSSENHRIHEVVPDHRHWRLSLVSGLAILGILRGLSTRLN